ncbi:N-acetyltransferase family protein [Leptolyngbya sp. AN02str]|uniref:GNAT family N-acetyltransferase n=1 Tax=Leptolyngbya sp. AN02str TaxID=3423363 RepID=UPI003D317ADB
MSEMEAETQQAVTVRAATPAEDGIVASHFYQLWLDNQVAPSDLLPDSRDRIVQFIAHARIELSYQAFVAEVNNRIVGSAGGQEFAGLYPAPFVARYRKYGYVWGVYVEAAYRRRGIAKQLTTAVLDHLKQLNCTRAILHASPAGQSVYTHLGFVNSNEMRLDLG